MTRLELSRQAVSKSNSYSMACPPVHGDNPRALASRLSCVQVDMVYIFYTHTSAYTLHITNYFVIKLVRVVLKPFLHT